MNIRNVALGLCLAWFGIAADGRAAKPVFASDEPQSDEARASFAEEVTPPTAFAEPIPEHFEKEYARRASFNRRVNLQPEAATYESAQQAGGYEEAVSDPSLWYVSAGAVAFSRAATDSFTNVVGGAPGFNPLSQGNQFSYDFQPGYQLEVGRRRADGRGFQVRYLRVHWDDKALITPGQAAFTPFGFNNPGNVRANTAIGLNNAAAQVQMNYQSNLQSAEFNGRRQATENIGLLAGFRYIELAEDMSLIYARPGNAFRSIQRVGGLNEMFGAQVGGDAVWIRRELITVESFAKAGVYYNDVSNRASVISTTPLIRSAIGAKQQTSFVGEIGLSGMLRLTDNWHVSSGYNLMWLDRVALAGEQIAVSNIAVTNTAATQTSRVDAGGSLIAHGATFNLIYSR